MRALTISLGGMDKAAITVAKSMSWETFARALTTEPPEVTDKAARGWYIPATFDSPRRHGDNFVSRDAITFDFDHVNLDSWGIVSHALQDYSHAIYTTFSHTYTEPRFRVVVPLSRPVSADEYQAISRKLAAQVGIELVAAESFKPAQMMYLPTRKLGAPFVSAINEGKGFLDADKVLGCYDDWTNRAEWPHRAAGDDLHDPVAAITPPDCKPGIIGEFCRRFRVAEAIGRFDLPYRPGNTPGRWTYSLGSVPEGCIEYDEGLKFHSHHDTDPCRGQHNTFDLVRITRFGHLDSGGCEGVGPCDRPSYRAMVDFVRSLPEFRPTASGEFENLRQEQDVGGSAAVRPAGPTGTETPAGRPEIVDGAPQRFVVREPADFSSGPPMDWIVRGVLPRAELAVVYGESGSGKSFLALDLCAAVCRGLEWRSRKVARGPCVYVCAEGAGGFKARLRAYARGHSVEVYELPAVIADTPNLLDEKEAAEVYGAILRWGKKPEVIVIDTLSATLAGGNENSGEDMGRVLSHCKLLHRRTGALVVLIHHSGKDATKGARGWSGLRAAADAEIEITRNGDYRTATVTKMKDGTDNESFSFKLKVIELDPLNDEPQSSCVIEHIEGTPSVAKAKAPLKGLPKMVHDTLATMAPSGTCDVLDLIAGVVKKLPKDDEGRDLRRQDVRNAIKRSLLPSGYAFMHGEDRISLTNLQSGEPDWLET